MYYLQSRYYDPEIGRFINADALTSTGQGLLGNNMFAYCLDNPVMYRDQTGYDAVILYDEDFPGHIGAMAEDEEGNWWHFYWGTQGGKEGSLGRIACVFFFPVESYTWCEKYTGEIDRSSINDAQQFSGDYEGFYYLEGDFSECVKDLQNASGQYHLYKNNCSQQTLRILSKADTVYASILKDTSTCFLPSVAARRINRYLLIEKIALQAWNIQ